MTRRMRVLNWALVGVLLLGGSSRAAEPKKTPGAKPTTPAATPAAATPTPTPTPAPAPAEDANYDSYNAKLQNLEKHVNELKEEIFAHKARLNLLKETVLRGNIAGARATIVHRNEMGIMYIPVQYVYALDGAEIFARADDSGKLGEQKEFEIFSGSIVPGNHTLTVQMVYQGNGLGVFSYVKGYKFTAKSSHTFTTAEGKQLQLKVVGFEQGNALTTDPKDRPAVDFRESIVSAAAKPAAAK